MRAFILAFVLSLQVACDDDSPPRLEREQREDAAVADASVDASDDASDADTSTDASELPPIERRSEPECEPLGRVESADVSPVSLETDFFMGCPGYEPPIADRAFTWTAPASGLYVFSLGTNVLYDARLSLELRRGDCVLKEGEGGTEPADEQVCAGSYLTEDGSSPPYQVLDVDEGETITLVVEGDDFYIQQDPRAVKRQSVGLSVHSAPCPAAPMRIDGEPTTTVEELPSHAPVYFEIYSTALNGHRLRALSCVETSNTRQYGLAWTAPETGRYAFEAEGIGFSSVPIGIAVLEEACSGDELACESGDERAAVSLVLQAGQRVVLMVELEAFSDDDERIALRVRSETATPEHAECEPLPEGSTVTAAAFRTSNHFFPNCADDLDLPDKAFTWRAPESGMFAFSLTNDANFGGARSDLMLLRGDCVQPTEVEPICADRHAEAGSDIVSFHAVIAVDEGEVITIVANGDDAYVERDFLRRQALTLRVEPAGSSRR